MTENELRAMKRDLEMRYKRDRDTLDKMIDLFRRQQNGTQDTPPEADEGMFLKDRIAKFVREMEGHFTFRDLKEAIRIKAPQFAHELRDETISATLAQMKRDEDIKVVVPKKGRSAAIYEVSEG